MLGTAQTLGYASTFYLPAMLAEPMARDLGIGNAAVFAAFSLAMLLSALVGPSAGRLIDRHGGRGLLSLTSLGFALGLLALACAQGPWSLVAAWLLLGLGMGAGLYESAFATLVWLYGRDAGRTITGITLLAGFASTVGWPLSAWMDAYFGWRGACVGWALLHLGLGLPLNALLPSTPPGTDGKPATSALATQNGPPGNAPHEAPDESPRLANPVRVIALLAFVFAAAWFCATAMATHLPRLLQAGGATLAAAVAAGALVGPAQVAGRWLEFALQRRLHPLRSARVAAAGHPLGALLFGLAGATPLATGAFAVLHGLGNGILTIAKGTLPLVYFGPAGYGRRQGWLMMPARIAQAAAPWLFGLALDAWGRAALALTAAIGLAAWIALLVLPRPPP
ncbi:MFS transporter [Sphaerotilus microaerophilus]|uniref:MFS transporter n=1 Tax=Sphaerotilus microaerophilus TaxID=2914710 RepID=A0ABM7YGP3_9BURK|nr:MFS transporter [Sphaerotilus sp. FB-5]BDI03472.1 MFS transporter [Sphaerotilus sp. FB-5]